MTNLPGFIPGFHCTEVTHYVKGELVPCIQPPKIVMRHGNRQSKLYVCVQCLPDVMKGIARSDAAFRGVETRRRKGGKRAPR